MPGVYYQQVGPEHILGLQSICYECFPTSDYPDYWYSELLENGFAYGAFEKATDKMVGMIVAEKQNILHAEDEVGTLLESLISVADTVVYIPIFGVSKAYRRQGIGTNLMQRLLYHAQTYKDTRVVYLHVESTNGSAINFYELCGFHYFTCIPQYYYGEGIMADGLVYVMYMNGGQPYNGGRRDWHKSYVRQCSIGLNIYKSFNNQFQIMHKRTKSV